MISILRTILTMLIILVLTVVMVALLLVAVLLRVPHRPGSMYERLPRFWSSAILWSAGVKLRVHGRDRVKQGGPFIFTSNHVSLFDIPALVVTLPPHYFVAKAELFKIPVFGPGIRAVGAIPIRRDNQKAALGAYDTAVDRVRAGASVVVFPEGTRGTSYPVRPFKKGPFVFALNAGVPIVPCLVHGTIEVLPKNSIWLHAGGIDIHILEPIPTAGMTYRDRDALALQVHDRMAEAMKTLYSNQ
ncbi:MAG: lysophospholipid acyltransferase family protein [Gemmatimonadaceae bacterium]